MTNSVLPEKVTWTPEEWKIFAQLATNNRKYAPPAMALKSPDLFIDSSQGYILNNRKSIVRHYREYVSNSLIKKGIFTAQEQSKIRIIAAGVTPSITDAIQYHLSIGTENTPLYVKILIDTPSYEPKDVELFEQRLSRFIGQALSIRGIQEPFYSINIDDISDERYGCYSGESIIGSTQISNGYRAKDSIRENPKIIHAWRSKHPNMYLIQEINKGGIQHIQELYLRWIDGKESPHVVPLNDELLQEHLSEWFEKFKCWYTLDIRSRSTLRHLMLQSEQGIHPIDLDDHWNQDFFQKS